MLNTEKIKGCFWGLVLGDALGQPVEFFSIEKIREMYGENGIQAPKENAIWTDDTEMTMAVTKALITMGGVERFVELDDNDIGEIFAKEFITWLDNPGYAPGITTTGAVGILKAQGPKEWRISGKNDSKGCGTVMRAAPLGLWFSNALKPELPAVDGLYHKTLAKVSTIQSEITHGHKAATAAALAGSYAVVLAINGTSPDKMIQPIQTYCNHIHPDFNNAMERLKTSLLNRSDETFKTDLEALTYIGQGWVGDEAFAMALYCAIQYPNDLKSCLRVAVNHDGDSDSVACIAGGILGAFNGVSIIPKDWVDKLAEKERMMSFLHQIIGFFKV
ncbi:MAG: ADP-ribosylglycohydrolase family protein [Candidatus Lokiarchaeota archaeon]|nr:ADP-ribosylglycohydrolase family protein [Candidatus Lokiarchaeota archaeon]